MYMYLSNLSRCKELADNGKICGKFFASKQGLSNHKTFQHKASDEEKEKAKSKAKIKCTQKVTCQHANLNLNLK